MTNLFEWQTEGQGQGQGCDLAGARVGGNPNTAVDLRELERLGGMLDWRHGSLEGQTTAMFLAESLLRVRGKDGRVHRLRANAVQRAYEQRRGLGNLVLKARQMGLTTWIAGRFLLKTVTRPGTLTLQVAHTQQSAEEILRIVHRFVELLPEGLRMGALRTAKRNVRQIVFPLIDSEYRVVSAADPNAGRGMTVQNLHCSEVARWGSARDGGAAAEILAGLRAGLVPGGEQVLESTPNGAEGCFYEEWQRAGSDGTEAGGLVRHFFPWWLEEGYRAAAVAEDSLTEEERELMAGPGLASGLASGLDLEQIGYRRMLKAGYRELARQEYVEDAETCFRVSGESYFELEAIEERLKSVPRPVGYERNRQQEVYLPSLPGKRYVVAVDPAGGGAEGDWSVVEVLDLETGMQCLEYGGHVSGGELAEIAAEIGWSYNTATVVVERNNHGSGLLWLLRGKVGYREIYQSGGQDGFLTTSLSRPQILARMSAALSESPWIFNSRKLLVECRSFVRLRSGGMGARHGSHDDRVMAMAIGLAAREELLGGRQGTGNRDQGAV